MKKRVTKKRVVIYGNCQMGALWGLLERKYPDEYEYQYIPWEHVEKGGALPRSMWKADFFVYQPTHLKNYESAPMAKRFHEKGVPAFAVPIPIFQGYHPDFTQDPLNVPTKSAKRPFGRFPYGMQAIMNLRGTMSPKELLAETKKDDFIPRDYAERSAYFSLALLRKTEAITDIRLADFIEANYSRQCLFHSVDHPTNILLQRQFDPVFDFLSLPRVDLSKEANF